MTDYLTITDPQTLREAVSHELHTNPFAFMVADATVDGVAAAVAFAPDNKHLQDHDRWVAESITEATREDDGIRNLPAPGEAFIVSSAAYSFEEFGEHGGWHRRAESLPEDGGPLHRQRTGKCHRCTWLLDGETTPVAVFHIAHGRVVVEFVVCYPCVALLALEHGPIRFAEARHGAV